jgi:tRNA modification GTPase
MSDTIFALASGSWRAGVAVVRVSGPAATATLDRLSGRETPAPRVATLTELKDGGAVLDHALVLYFKAPASFTGEDVVEYHLHGGRAVIEGVLAALGKIKDCRPATPGEFTRRAFENGKMDLTQAEAVADLIAAETEAQRAQALSQLGGGLSRLYGDWADRLARILAHQEAEIEFPDENMPEGIAEGVKFDVKQLVFEIERHLDDGHRGERLREGIRVAIFGAPNAGKSSLLNALARRDAAIVSPEEGTTRDVIEVHLDIGGCPVILMDTAGLRSGAGAVESEGIRRAREAARSADIRLALFDGTKEEDAETKSLAGAASLVVYSKADLAQGAGLRVSALTGAGMDSLVRALADKVSGMMKEASSGALLTRARHRAALEETCAALSRSLAAALPELAAEDLRLALRALGGITGRVHVEDLLDRIFRDFCIGK